MPSTEALVGMSGLIAAVSTATAGLLVIGLHVLSTGVDPVRDGVSGYALGRWVRLYQVQAISSGVAAALVVLGCGALGVGPLAGLVALGVYAAARFAIVGYPTDPPGTVVLSATGRTHALLAAAAFLSLAVAAPTLGLTLAASPPWDRVSPVLVAISVAVPVTVVATFAAGGLPAFRRVFGLVERMLYASWLSWLLVVALGLAISPIAT
jgi:hypothetical protein